MSPAVQRAVGRFWARRRSLDLAAAQATLEGLYRDLAERMWQALAEVKARAVKTHDEDKGHEFHGNQWTGGLGAKPKTHSQKTSKAAVHELLSSGHPFTKQELMEIAGIKTEKLFSDYMAMLKNPKYAGPKGALSIQMKDGHYYVALPNGNPAPPLEPATKATALPPHLQALAEKIDGKAAPSHTITEVHVPGYTQEEPKPAQAPPAPSTPAEKATVAAPAPSAAPSLTPEEKAVAEQPVSPYIAGLEALTKAHPGSMTKSEADKHYEQALAAANVYMASAVKKSDVPGGHKAVLSWKNQKAALMAAWATAVHGHPLTAKAQQMYKADEKLADEVAQGTPVSQAIANWKANTSAEKMGNFPPKAVTPATKAAAASPEMIAQIGKIAAGTDMGHAKPVQPIDYHALVPESHEPIGPQDFATDQGNWYKGLSKLRSQLEAESNATAQDNKKSVEHKLRQRLKDKPNFQALVKRLGLAKEGYQSLESRLIATWAGSSGDHNDLSVAMQMAVRDAFSIPDGHIEKAALGSLNAVGHDVDALTKKAIQSINGNIDPLKPHEVQTARAALQEFVQAQYEETQDHLAKLGHDHVYLARGMKMKTAHQNHQGAANVKLQPASSFSASYSTANSFAGHGTVFLVKVPRQQVLSHYLTGFGCTGEHEVVVLAHDKLKAFTVNAGTTQGGAASTVAAQVKGKLAAAPPEAPKAKPVPKAKPLTPENAALQKASQAFIASALTHDPATHAAALKKAVINAKSKALKAKVAAEKKFPGNQAKAAHAAKAAEEAKQAVAALQAFLKGSK